MKKFKLRSRSHVGSGGQGSLGPIRDYIVTVDEGDAHWLRSKTWHVQHSDNNRYCYVRSGDEHALLARYVLGLRNTPNLRITYRDGNGLNNCRDNLEVNQRSLGVEEVGE